MITFPVRDPFEEQQLQSQRSCCWSQIQLIKVKVPAVNPCRNVLLSDGGLSPGQPPANRSSRLLGLVSVRKEPETEELAVRMQTHPPHTLTNTDYVSPAALHLQKHQDGLSELHSVCFSWQLQPPLAGNGLQHVSLHHAVCNPSADDELLLLPHPAAHQPATPAGQRYL